MLGRIPCLPVNPLVEPAPLQVGVPRLERLGLHQQIGMTVDTLVRLRSSAEGQEGLAAFLEKRAPEWTR